MAMTMDHGRPESLAQQAAHVTWYREPHLRRLYFLSIFLLMGSATTGFDGMLQNTSQQMDAWKAYFPEHRDANKLGILINMYSVGSITSFLVAPYMADTLGRKPTIMAGCVVMTAGACVTAFGSGYGSESDQEAFDQHGVASASNAGLSRSQCTLADASSLASAARCPTCARPCCWPRYATPSTAAA